MNTSRSVLAALCLFGGALATPASAQYSSSYYGGYNSPAMQQIRRNMITNAINRQTAHTGATTQGTTRSRPTTTR